MAIAHMILCEITTNEWKKTSMTCFFRKHEINYEFVNPNFFQYTKTGKMYK